MPDNRLRVVGRDSTSEPDLPPGQHTTREFPAVSTENPPHIGTDVWTFTITVGDRGVRTWNWAEFRALPSERFTVDVHSVDGWSKLATSWDGVPLGVLFEGVHTTCEYVRIGTYGEYTTNLPLEDLLDMPSWIAFGYEGRPLHTAHGGPARLLVPHLYLWKSAKWIRSITVSNRDEPGTRERAGLHNYGDPWREQRYRGTPST